MGFVLFIVLVAALAAGAWWWYRGRDRSHPYPNQPTIPVLFQPDGSGPSREDVDLTGDWKTASGAPGGNPTRRPERNPVASPEMIGRPHGPPPEEPSRPRPEPNRQRRGGGDGLSPKPERAIAESTPIPSASPVGLKQEVEDEDQTLQLLPGRMEVVAGGTRGREIRFIRVPSETYTFGRRGDSDPSHIQLQNATVSREHAAMRHVNGRWRIRNLSSTNPLRINGEVADTPGKEYTLHDGDRIEMGEVAFLFREK